VLELTKLKEKEVFDAKNDFTNKKQIRELKKQIDKLFFEINSRKKNEVVQDMNLNIGNTEEDKEISICADEDIDDENIQHDEGKISLPKN